MTYLMYLALLITCGLELKAQTVTAITGSGYEYSLPFIPLAPGQLLTVFLSGLPAETQSMRAREDVELPTRISGISARMSQFQALSRTQTALPAWDVPILEVRRLLNCRSFFGGCFQGTAGVTIQVPFELHAPGDQACSGCVDFAPGLSVIVNGLGAPVDVTAVRDRVRILRVFDAVLDVPAGAALQVGACHSQGGAGFYAPVNYGEGYPCPPLVMHSDRSLVTETNPAKPGEELVALAVGLGRTDPPSLTGKPTVTSAPTVTSFTIDFNYRPNALASKPPHVDSADAERPLYTGSARGTVGQYEIRFRVPPPPPGTPACGESGLNHIWSNLTVSIGGRDSFDGAGVCVAMEGANQ